MKTTSLWSTSVGIAILFFSALGPARGFSQTTDSLVHKSCGSLQFHLFGGFGVDYIQDLGAGSFLRLGVDGSYSHSNSSGDGNSYSTYTSIYDTSGSFSSTNPEGKSTSYSIALSGIYAKKVVAYEGAVLYCGLGPMVSFNYYNGSSSTSSSIRTESGNTEVDTYLNDGSSRAWGIGPLAIVGIKSHMVGNLSLNAEVDVSALYQRSSHSSASHSTYTYTTPSYTSSNDYGSNSSDKGWNVSLSSVRIGVILGL